MGRLFLVELDAKSYRCKTCNISLALADHVVSRAFSCPKGRAFLFKEVVNVSFGPDEERRMMSGMQTVADVFCCGCGQLLGWKYIIARDKNQKYKEGKVAFERWRITLDSRADYEDELGYGDPNFRQLVRERLAPIYGLPFEEQIELLQAFWQDPVVRQFQAQLAGEVFGDDPELRLQGEVPGEVEAVADVHD